ncbi:hypothetical protein Mapa_005329 [Marchantia paleacea]|nr:hypothetical protein Mapa_005329 [Marchantia paleacea]
MKRYDTKSRYLNPGHKQNVSLTSRQNIPHSSIKSWIPTVWKLHELKCPYLNYTKLYIHASLVCYFHMIIKHENKEDL